MKKFIKILIISVSFVQGVQAQSFDSLYFIRHFSFSVGSGVNYRILDPGEPYAWIRDIKDDIEIGKAGFNVSLNWERYIGLRFLAGVGMSVTNMGYQTRKMDALWTGLDPAANYQIKRQYIYRYLSADVNLIYYIPGKESLFFLYYSNQLMGRTGVFVKEQLYEGNKEADVFRNDLDQSAALKIGGKIGFGIEKNIDEAYRLRIFPTVRYVFDDFNESYYTNHLYAIDLNMALIWRYEQ